MVFNSDRLAHVNSNKSKPGKLQFTDLTMEFYSSGEGLKLKFKCKHPTSNLQTFQNEIAQLLFEFLDQYLAPHSPDLYTRAVKLQAKISFSEVSGTFQVVIFIQRCFQMW